MEELQQARDLLASDAQVSTYLFRVRYLLVHKIYGVCLT